MKKILSVLLVVAVVSSVAFGKIYNTTKVVPLDNSLMYSDLQEPALDKDGRHKYIETGSKRQQGYYYNKSINEILKGSQIGIINGYPDGTFKPNDSVSKGDFVKLAIGLALGVNSDINRIQSYDIPTTVNHYTGPYIAIAEIQGIITPGDINNENVMDPITRIEMITILSNIQIKMKGIPQYHDGELPNYSDIYVLTEEQKALILHAAKYRLLENMDNSVGKIELKPFSYLTRAEAARALMRIY